MVARLKDSIQTDKCRKTTRGMDCASTEVIDISFSCNSPVRLLEGLSLSNHTHFFQSFIRFLNQFLSVFAYFATLNIILLFLGNGRNHWQ